MSAVKVPANLPELVRAKFNTAKANGDVNFYPTQVAVLQLGSVPVRSRCPLRMATPHKISRKVIQPADLPSSSNFASHHL